MKKTNMKMLSWVLGMLAMLSAPITMAWADTANVTDTDGNAVEITYSGATVTTGSGGASDVIFKFTSSGSLTIPEGYQAVARYLVVGGGGGGGKAGTTGLAGKSSNGGNAGSVAHNDTQDLIAGQYTITVGAGGSGKSSGMGGGSGNDGNASTLVGPSGSGLNVTAAQGTGGSGPVSNGSSKAGSGNDYSSSITGVEVVYAQAGKASSSSSSGNAGETSGSGGQGAYGSGSSGAGADGIVVIRIYQLGIVRAAKLTAKTTTGNGTVSASTTTTAGTYSTEVTTDTKTTLTKGENLTFYAFAKADTENYATFTGWANEESGEIVSTANPYAVQVSAVGSVASPTVKTVYAKFAPRTVKYVTFNASGLTANNIEVKSVTANGVAVKADSKGRYVVENGATVVVEFQALSGWKITGGTNPLSLGAVSADTEVAAASMPTTQKAVYVIVKTESLATKMLKVTGVKNTTTGENVAGVADGTDVKYPLLTGETASISFGTTKLGKKAEGNNPRTEGPLSGDVTISAATENLPTVVEGSSLPNEVKYTYLGQTGIIGYDNAVVTTNGEDLILTYTNTTKMGQFEFPSPKLFTVQILAVAGGGAGGTQAQLANGGGGGGAGGYMMVTNTAQEAGLYYVVVGEGGKSSTNTLMSITGGNGGNSIVTNSSGIALASTVGGGGGGASLFNSDVGGQNGGSGGGGAWVKGRATVGGNGAGGNGRDGQGNDGGKPEQINNGGGGGGAAAVGGANGVGGAGITNAITGVDVCYAQGGNGGRQDTIAAAKNGMGYGWGGDGGNGGIGGNGGDGIVIVRITKMFTNIQIEKPTVANGALFSQCAETNENSISEFQFNYNKGEASKTTFRSLNQDWNPRTKDGGTVTFNQAIHHIEGIWQTNAWTEVDGGSNIVYGVGHRQFVLYLNEGYSWIDDSNEDYGLSTGYLVDWRITTSLTSVDAEIRVEKTVEWDDNGSNATVTVMSHSSPAQSPIPPKVLFIGTMCDGHTLRGVTILKSLNALAKKGEVDWFCYNGANKSDSYRSSYDKSDHLDYLSEYGTDSATVEAWFPEMTTSSNTADYNNAASHACLNSFYAKLDEVRQNKPDYYDYIVFLFDGTRIADKSYYTSAYTHEQEVSDFVKKYYDEKRVIWVCDNCFESSSDPWADEYWRPNTYWNNGSSQNLSVSGAAFRGLIGLFDPYHYNGPSAQPTYTANSGNYYACDRWDMQRNYEQVDELYKYLEENIKPVAYNLRFSDKIMQGVGLSLVDVNVYVATNDLERTAPVGEGGWQHMAVWDSTTKTIDYSPSESVNIEGMGDFNIEVTQISSTSNLVSVTITNMLIETWAKIDIRVTDDGTFKTSVNATWNEATGQWEKNPNDGKAQVAMVDENNVETTVKGEAATSAAWKFYSYQVMAQAKYGEVYLNGEPGFEIPGNVSSNSIYFCEGYSPLIYYRGLAGYAISSLLVDGVYLDINDYNSQYLIFEHLANKHDIYITYENYVQTAEALATTNAYDGLGHVFDMAVELTTEYDYEVRYSLTEGGTYLTTNEFLTTYGSQVKDVGNHTLYYKVYAWQPGHCATNVELEGWAEVAAGSGVSTITKATLTITANAKTLAVGDDVPTSYTAQYSGFVNGETKSSISDCGTLKYRTNYTKGSPAGTYYIEPYGLTEKNYHYVYVNGPLTVSDSGLKALEIGGIPQSEWLSPETNGVNTGVAAVKRIYDGIATSIVVKVTKPASGATIQYSLDNQNWSSELPTFTNAVDKAKVYYAVSASGYVSITNYQYVTVSKRPVVLLSMGAEKVYDGWKLETNEVNVVTGAGLYDFVKGESVSTWCKARLTEVGTLPNLFDIIGYSPLSVSNNYEFIQQYGTLKVTIAPMKIGDPKNPVVYPIDTYPGLRPEPGSNGVENIVKEYDGVPTNIVVNVVFPEDGYKVLYTHTPDIAESWTENFALTNVCDGYGVYFSVNHDNCAAVTNIAYVTIKPRAAIVKANDATKEYDGQPLANATVTTEGLVAGQGVTATMTDDSTITHAGTTNNVIATLTPMAGTLLSNYTITTNTGTLAVTPRPITLQSGSSSVKYVDATTSVTTDVAKISVVKGSYVEGEKLDYIHLHHIDNGPKSDNAVFEAADSSTAKLDDYAVTYEYGVLTIGENNIQIGGKKYGDDGQPVDAGSNGVENVKVPYDGKGHSIKVEVTYPVEDSTTVIEYSIDDGATWTTENPSFTNVCAETVKFAVKIDGYQAITNAATVTITERPITVTANDQTMVYAGVAPVIDGRFTVDSPVEGDVYGVPLAWNGEPTVAAVGTNENFIVTNALIAVTNAAKAEVTSNYTIAFEPGDLVVTKATITPTVPTIEKQYDGQATNVVVTVDQPTGAKVLYRLPNGEWTNELSITHVKLEKGQPVPWSVEVMIEDPAGNYETFTTNVSVMINPRPITITALDFSMHIDDVRAGKDKDAYKVLATYDNTYPVEKLTDEDLATIEYTIGVSGYIEVGVSPIDVNGNMYQGDFVITWVDGSLTIFDKEQISYGFEGGLTNCYDGAGHTLTPTTDVPVTVTCALTQYGPWYNPDDPACPVVTNVTKGAGAIIWFALTADDPLRYQSVTNYAVVVVTQKVLTVTASDLSVMYDSEPPAQSEYSIAKYDGFVPGEDASVLTGTLHYDTNYKKGDRGTFYIRPSGLVPVNYSYVYVDGTLYVGDMPMIIGGVQQPLDPTTPLDPTASGVEYVEKYYDGEPTNLVITLDQPTSGYTIAYRSDDGHSWKTTPFKFTDASTSNKVWYAITAPNYVAVTNYQYVTIKPRPVMLQAASATKEYDAKPLTATGFDVLAQYFVKGQGVASVTCAGSQTDVGESDNTITGYTLKSGTYASNYEITLTNGLLSVTKRKFPGDDRELNLDATNFVYNAKEQGPVFTNDYIVVDGVQFPTNMFDIIDNVGKDAADHTLIIRAKEEYKKNFEGEISVPWSITKRPLTVRPDNATVMFGEPMPSFTWTGSGYAEGEDDSVVDASAIAWTCAYTASATVGETFDIEVAGLGAANYEISYEKGTLTVVDKIIEVPNAALNLIYDGTNLVGVAEGYGYTVVGGTAKDAGDYTATVSLKPGYHWSDGDEDKTVNWSIGKRTVTLKAKSKSQPYNGSKLELLPEDITGQGYAVNELGQSECFKYVDLAWIIDYGTVEATFTPVDSTEGVPTKVSNYTIEYDEKAYLTILTAVDQVAVVAESEVFAYDGQPHSNLNWTVDNGHLLNAGDEVQATIDATCVITTPADGIITNKFSGYRVWRAAESKEVTLNYNITNYVGYLTMTNGVITGDNVMLTSTNGVYDGTYYTINVESNKLTNGEYPVIKYGLSPNGPWYDEPFKFKDATNVTVYVVAEPPADAPYYTPFTNTATIVIGKRPVTFTSRDKTASIDVLDYIEVEDADITAVGLVGSEEFSFSNYAALDHVGEIDASFNCKPIASTGAKAGNYEVKTVYGKLTLTNGKAIGIKAASDNFVFDGATHTNWNYTIVNGPDEGIYEVEVKFDESSALTYPGTVENLISTVRVYKIVGHIDATTNFTYDIHSGTLTMAAIKMPEGIGGISTNAVYDGSEYQIGVTVPTGLLTTPVTNYSQYPTGPFGATNPAYSDAGTYTTYFTVSAPGYVTETNSATVKIDPRPIQILSGSATNVYNKTALVCHEAKVVSELGFVSGQGCTYTFSGEQTIVGFSGNMFSYELNDNTKEGNYDIEKLYGELRVTPATFTDFTLVGWDGDYSSDGHQIELTIDDSYGAEKRYATIEGIETAYEVANPAYTNAGTYTTYVKIKVANYAVIYTNALVTVNPKAVTITSADGKWAYDRKAHGTNGVTAVGFVAGEGVTTNVTGTITEVGTADNAFTYEFLANTSNINYAVTCVTGKLEVAKRKFPGENQNELYLDATNFVYTAFGQGPKLTNDVITIDGVDFPAEWFEVTGNVATNVDTYTLTVAPKTEYRKNFEGEIEVKWVITPATLTVTAGTLNSVMYGAAAPEYIWTATGYQGMDTADDIGGTPVYSSSYWQGMEVGTYAAAISVTGLTAKNYTMVYVPGDLVVRKRAVILKAPTKVMTYNGKVLTFGASDITISGEQFYNGQNFKYSNFASIMMPGVVESTFTYVEDTAKLSNYAVTIEPGTLTINASIDQVVVTAASGTWCYDTQEHSTNGWTIVNDELFKQNGDVFIGEIDAACKVTTPGEGVVSNRFAKAMIVHYTNATDYVDVTSSYELYTVAGSLQVTNAQFEVTNLDGLGCEKTYDGKGYTIGTPAFTVPSGVTATIKYATAAEGPFELTKPTFTNAAAAAHTVYFTIAADWYDTYTNSATVKINRRPLTFKTDDQMAIEGETLTAAPKLVSGTFVDGEGATFTDCATLATPGEQPAEFTVAFNANTLETNYAVTKQVGTLYILPAESLGIKAKSASRAFNGEPFRCEEYDTVGTIDPNHVLEVVFDPQSVVTYPEEGIVDNLITTVRVWQVSGAISNDVTSSYTILTKKGTLAVTPYDGIELTMTSTNAVYDATGYTVGATAAATPYGGTVTMRYAPRSEGSYVAEKPMYTNVGEYAVWCVATAPGYAAKTNSATVTITKRTATITSVSETFTYNGAAHAANGMASADGFVGDDGVESVSCAGSITDVGTTDNAFTYTLKSGTREENYTIETVPGTLTVTPAKMTDFAEDYSVTTNYDGEGHTFDFAALSNKLNGIEFHGNEYAVKFAAESNATIWAVAPFYHTNVADSAYTFWYRVSANNFAPIYRSVGVKINPRPVTIESKGGKWVYDAKAHATNEVVTANFVAGEGVTTNVTGTITEVGTADNAFTYGFIDGTKASNYEVTCVTGKLEVTKCSFPGTTRELFLDATNFVYNGKLQGPVFTNAFIIVDGVEFSTNLFHMVENEKKDVGEYTLEIVPNNPDNFDGTIAVAWEITKKNLTIKVDDITIPYGSAKPAFTWTGTGYVEGEGPDDITGPAQYKCNYNIGDASGDYEVSIKPSTLTSANYAITLESGVLTVGKCMIPVPMGAKNLYYNGEEQDGVTNGTGYKVWGGDYSATDAGTYIAVVRLNGTGYQWEDGTTGDKNVEWSILKRRITLRAKTKTKVYNGVVMSVEADEIKAEDMGYVNGESFEYYDFASIVDVGRTPASFKYREAKPATAKLDNYAVTVDESAYLEVTIADDQIMVTATNATWCYDGEAHSNRTISVEHAQLLAPGDTLVPVFDAKSVITEPGAVSNHIVEVKVERMVEGVAVNVAKDYKILVRDGLLTVTNAQIEVTNADAMNWSGKYDGKTHTISALPQVTVNGGVDYAIKYAADGSTDYALDAPPSYKNVKGANESYVIGYKITADHHDDYIGTATVTILKRVVEFTSDSEAKKYNGTSLMVNKTYVENSLKGDGFVKGELWDVIDLAKLDSVGQIPASFEIEFGSKALPGNYEIVKHFGTLTLYGANTLYVTAASEDFTYCGEVCTNHTFTVAGDGYGDGDIRVEVDFDPASALLWPEDSPVANTITAVRIYSTENGSELTASYTVITNMGVLTMKPATIDWGTIDPSTFVTNGVYNGEKYTVNIEKPNGVIGTPTMTFSANNPQGYYTDTIPGFIDAGENVIYYTVSVPGYHTITNEALVTINPRPVTLVSEGATKVYDGSALKNENVAVKDGSLGFVTGDNFTATFGDGQVNVGSSGNIFDYSLTGSAKVSNYTITKEYGTLTVTPAAMSVSTLKGHEGDYDGYAHVIDEVKVSMPDAKYYFAAVEGIETAYVETKTAWTNAGEYVCYVKIAAPNYSTFYTNATVKINKRQVEITSGSWTWMYDGSDHAYTNVVVSHGSFAKDENITTNDFAKVNTVGVYSNSFEFAWGVNGSDAANYDLTVVTGVLTVVASSNPTIDPDDDPENPHDPEAGPFDGPELPGGPKIPPMPTNRTDGVWSKLSNYDVVVPYDGELHTINVAALSNALDKAEFHGNKYTLTYSLTGNGGWEEAPYYFKNVTDTPTSFWYRVAVPNYTNYIHAAAVTITQRVSTVTFAAADKTFDTTTTATCIATNFSNLVEGESFSLNTDGFEFNFEQANTGRWTVTASNYPDPIVNSVVAGVDSIISNYTFRFVNTTNACITAKAANFTVEVSPEEFVWNGTAKMPAVTVKDGALTLKSGVDYTCSPLTAIDVAKYTISVTGVGNYAGGSGSTNFWITAHEVETWVEDTCLGTNQIGTAISSNEVFADCPAKEGYCVDAQNSITNGIVRRVDDAEGLLRLVVRYEKDFNGDGIPDKFQRRFTFRVVNGWWDADPSTPAGGSAPISLWVTKFAADGVTWDVNGSNTLAAAQIPAAGNRPFGTGFVKVGDWWPVAPSNGMWVGNNTNPLFLFAYRRASGGGSLRGGGSSLPTEFKGTADVVDFTYSGEGKIEFAVNQSAYVNGKLQVSMPLEVTQVTISGAKELTDAFTPLATKRTDMSGYVTIDVDPESYHFFKIEVK